MIYTYDIYIYDIHMIYIYTYIMCIYIYVHTLNIQNFPGSKCCPVHAEIASRRYVRARPCLMAAMKKSVAAMKSKKVMVKGALETLENHFGLGKLMGKFGD